MSQSDTVFIPAPPIDQPGAVVECGPFWPDVDLANFRETMRVGNSSITPPRMIAALKGALLTIQQDLATWRAAREAEGHATLADCPAPELGSESPLLAIYRRAIYAYAAADLVETHGDITATAASVDKTKGNACTADDHRRNGLQAIRDMKGRRRITARMV